MYIQNGDTTADINSGANRGWVQLKRGVLGVSFHVNLAATGAPIGAFVFEISNDDDPTRGANSVILGAVPIALVSPYSGATYQPTDGTARNVVFDFGDAPLVNACPGAKWIRMRYARTSGGSAAAGTFNVDVHQRGI